eukprot:CCRYP_011899-RA/>CCRYP_011899-RA protein AED:0.05 eAED:0.05 QI:224/1/1/1/0.5/0.33/3/85/357
MNTSFIYPLPTPIFDEGFDQCFSTPVVPSDEGRNLQGNYTYTNVATSKRNKANDQFLDYVFNFPDVPEFLIQLYKILSNDSNSIYIQWREGKIVVKDPEGFERNVLHHHFKHSKFSSFTRQMNYFGFRKMSGGSRMAPCLFHNEETTSDLTSLFWIKRRKSSQARKLEKAHTQAVAPTHSSNTNTHSQPQQKEPLSHQKCVQGFGCDSFGMGSPLHCQSPRKSSELNCMTNEGSQGTCADGRFASVGAGDNIKLMSTLHDSTLAVNSLLLTNTNNEGSDQHTTVADRINMTSDDPFSSDYLRLAMSLSLMNLPSPGSQSMSDRNMASSAGCMPLSLSNDVHSMFLAFQQWYKGGGIL